jgi:hypothetical protein
MLATLCSVGKGRNHSFADRDEVCARPLDADALAADAGAFQQQPQRVGEQIGFGNPGVVTEPSEAVALFRLEFLDDVSRRMIAFARPPHWPCRGRLVNKGIRLLGASPVHQTAVLHDRPYVAFCDNLRGRHIGESGPKDASLLSIEDGQDEEISPLNVDVVRWTHLLVPVDQCGTAADAVDLIRQAIEDAVEREPQSRSLACRIELTG